MTEFEANLVCVGCGNIPFELWLEPIEGTSVKRHVLIARQDDCIDASICSKCGESLKRDR